MRNFPKNMLFKCKMETDSSPLLNSMHMYNCMERKRYSLFQCICKIIEHKKMFNNTTYNFDKEAGPDNISEHDLLTLCVTIIDNDSCIVLVNEVKRSLKLYGDVKMCSVIHSIIVKEDDDSFVTCSLSQYDSENLLYLMKKNNGSIHLRFQKRCRIISMLTVVFCSLLFFLNWKNFIDSTRLL